MEPDSTPDAVQPAEETVVHSTPSLLADTALSNPTLDRLDRAQFAQSLSRSILSLGGDDSFVIGLCGPWGSGKTSVLNFVQSSLDSAEGDKPILLRFNPWWFSGRQQLLEAFLAQFTAVLNAPKRGEKAKKAGKLLGTLSAALRPVTLIPGIGEAVKAGRDAIDAVAGAATAYADAVEQDVVGIRAQVDELLKEFPQRIIVVMDDIDRLAASEIAQLFLILKAVADFPKTVYLLAFDHKVVTQAINEQLGVDGRTYLEKIVQLQIDVPPTARTAIHQMFLEQLNQIIGPDDLRHDQVQYFWNVFHDGVKHFLITPRAVKKLTNMLRFAYPSLRGEVNAVDMVSVACLTTFVPQMIPTIAMNQGEFTGVGSRSYWGGHDDRKEREQFHRNWLSALSELDRGPVEAIVRRTFPSVDHALGGPGHSDDFNRIWQRDLRVCTDAHFEKYFRLTIPDGTISEAAWKSVVETFDAPETLDHVIATFATIKGRHGVNSQASEFLERALLFARDATPEASEVLFRSLMRVGDVLCAARDEKAINGMFPIDNVLRLTWVLHELLERFPGRRDRERLVNEVLDEKAGVFVATELVVSLGYQNGVFGSKERDDDPRHTPIVGKRFVGKLSKRIQKTLQEIAASDDRKQLLEHPAFMRVVINWWRIGGKAEPRRFLCAVTVDDAVLVSVLKQQISKTRSHGMSDRVAVETEVIDSGFLSKFLKLKEVRSRCERLLADVPQWLDERGMKSLQIAIHSITPNGRPIDHWAERRRKRTSSPERQDEATEAKATEADSSE
jgi:predicted KAP-like P-loop ATPase